MKEIGKRLRNLREGIGVSQEKLAKMLGTTQSSINRYENGQTEPPVELLRKYADMFDVSMDYIFARTDAPEGKMYKFQPKIPPDREEMQKFIEMCFVPGSIANTKLKESLYRIMEEKK
ncbi:helix-turn-helix transcriptional regulator [Clostridiales bacterium FE2010]|nr:helix-turn-helix transcriptional regulator [Clostridiales bacterium FE2010]